MNELERQRHATADKGLGPVQAAAVVAGIVGLSGILAAFHTPDPLHPQTRRWYVGLRKPPFTPPDPVFGAVWPVVEAGLAYGGYRLLRRPPGPARNTAVGLFLFNVGMIGGWSELFFGRKLLGASVVAAGAMVITGTAYVAAASRVDTTAAAAGAPFPLWVSFATLLAEEIWRRNSAPSASTAG